MRLAVVALALAACGYPPLPAQPLDATGGDADATPIIDGPIDAPIDAPIDVPIDVPQSSCAALATYGSPTPVDQRAVFTPAAFPEVARLTYTGRLTNESVADFLQVELYSGFGVFTGGLRAPVTIPLVGAELDYARCAGCVVIAANCVSCNLHEGTGTADYYMATSGTLQINTISPNMTGTLSNATFTHVTIENQGADPTYRTTHVGDCDSAIVSASFTALVE